MRDISALFNSCASGHSVDLLPRANGLPIPLRPLNLEGLEHDWFVTCFGIVVAGLRKYRPDIVCFQESTVRYAGRIYNQAQAIGEVRPQ
jgi:hypothetical protein